jgi:hypothetical protein
MNKGVFRGMGGPYPASQVAGDARQIAGRLAADAAVSIALRLRRRDGVCAANSNAKTRHGGRVLARFLEYGNAYGTALAKVDRHYAIILPTCS